MNLPTPRWWYAEDAAAGRLTRTLLTPAAWLWAAVTAVKIRLARPADTGAPVICVGNITLGGAGKSPVVRTIVMRLRARGVEAAGLSRGYGGKATGPLKVDPGRHAAAEVGDEPLMMAASVPFWVSRDRVAGVRAAVAAGAEAVVLDDGHQNPSLKKTLSLVVVDGETRGGEWPFGDGSVFPAGPMREPLKASLARADAVVLMMPADVAAPDRRLLALFEPLPVLIARFEPDAPPPGGRQVGFAGIGKPWKLERALRAAGCTLVDFAPYPDHHPYSAADLAFLAGRAADLGAGLVTSEKDWVRLDPKWRAKVKAWAVTARFEDEAALDQLLDRALGSSATPPFVGEESTLSDCKVKET
jgi:tetraacyldisaccharide 4'-kinase